jgi:hypothetical protein
MIDEDMLKIMVDHVNDRNPATFVDLENVLNAVGFETTGDLQMEDEDPNVIYWVGVNQNFIDTVGKGVEDGVLRMVPSDANIYIERGQWIDLPEVAKVPSNGYRTPHWSVVCFYPALPVEEEIEDSTPVEA